MTTGTLPNQYDIVQLGEYFIENNYWEDHVDFTNSISYSSADNSKVTFTTTWSGPVFGGNITGYPSVWVGRKPDWVSDYYINNNVVSKLNSISVFNVSHDIVVSPGSQPFDIAFDLWVQNEPNGNQDTVEAEVMIWLDTFKRPPDFGKLVCKYKNGAKTAKVYRETASSGGRSWKYISVVFDEPQLRTTTDIKHILDFLANKRLIRKTHYISGWALGAELSRGSGSVTFTDVDYTFTKAT